MSTAPLRNAGAALLAVAAITALAGPAASSAQPNNGVGGDGGKSCHLPGGKTIDSGSSGTDVGGISYQCNDGIACQVENGKKTDKCSHTERFTITQVKATTVLKAKAKATARR